MLLFKANFIFWVLPSMRINFFRKRREDLLRLKSVRSSVSLIFIIKFRSSEYLLIKGIQSKRNVMLLIHFNRVETIGFLSSVEKWVLEHACYHESMLGFVYQSNASSPLILSGFVHIGALKSFASALIRNFRCHWVSNFSTFKFRSLKCGIPCITQSGQGFKDMLHWKCRISRS